MGKKILMKGNEAVAEAAIRAGCKYFFGYPITPQNEIPEYMSRELPKRGGVYLQAEAEFAAANMLYGAAGSGVRVMTSSSSPGISLMAEGISYMVGAQLPCVIVNMVRGGPGLGNIAPAQSDYMQAVKGMCHGDVHLIVLAPSSVQEAVDLMYDAFDIADLYRNPVLVLGDGMIGQMMEPVEFKESTNKNLPLKTWATTGTRNSPDGKRRIINSLSIEPEDLENLNIEIQKKYKTVVEKEIRYEEYKMSKDLDIIFASYGTTSRITKYVIKKLEEDGIKAGLIRPITLWPFPSKIFENWAENSKAKFFLTVEMSAGQMVEDVKLSVNGKKPVYFYGRTGGMVPEPKEIIDYAKSLLKK